ncbi:MAG TPA: hypothetical protein ENN19_08795, partial [Chloroflexi bacterium]|nr:hypothetical protein [Chloroflexota bacterium]
MSPRANLEMLFRLILTLCIAVGLVGYVSVAGPVDVARADPPPPPPSEAQPVDTSEETSEEPVIDVLPSLPQAPYANASPITRTIHLKSRAFVPSTSNALTVRGLESQASRGQERVHVLVQLDFIPRQAAKEALEARGLKLLAYVPDYAWIASVSVGRATTALQSPGVAWSGELTVEDKLDPAITADRWGEWNRAPDGTVAVYVAMHQDESLDTGRALVAAHGGRVVGEVIGVNLLLVEMDQKDVRALAAADAVQWIEPAAPPLTEANDGIRQQIGVNVVQAAPYSLDGTNIDVLVYDGGRVGAHVDFGTRL